MVANPAGAAPHSWSIAPSPNTYGPLSSHLYGVSCASADSCTAVGYYNNGQTLVEVWNGTSWSIVPSPNVSGSKDNFLLGVSCTSATSCTAVGYYSNGTVDQTLAEAWNGTSWSITPSPNPSGSNDDFLHGVSCTTSASCTAVGDYYNDTQSTEQTLIEAWNGTSWSIVPSPDNSSWNDLHGISCASTASCTAVGQYYNGSDGLTLIEAWNGTSWSIVPSPNVSVSQFSWNVLLGVSCASTTSCTAVGYHNHGRGSAGQTLAETWNGTSWSIVTSPNPPGAQYSLFLRGVSCASTTSCSAVGSYNNGTIHQTLVEAWNGTSWSIVTRPKVSGSQGAVLRGVSCASTTSCTAAGYYNNGTIHQTLVEAWTGTSWSIATSPNPLGPQVTVLRGVSCVSTTSCLAVGYYYNGTIYLTLAEAWNGTSWSIVPSPN
ncbi:MAG: hypothetical protein ACYDEY_14465, partial [Acidimicrobiales bacterium]